MKQKIVLCLTIIIGLVSCTDTKIDKISGKVVDAKIIGKNNIHGIMCKTVQLKINVNSEILENSKNIKIIFVQIPLMNRDHESLPIEDKELIEEFPINALIETNLIYHNGKNMVIINSIQDHIVVYWP